VPSTATSAPATGAAVSATNLTGDWAFSGGGRIAVEQTGNQVAGVFSQGNSLCATGLRYFNARLEGNRLIGQRQVCNQPGQLEPLDARVANDGRSIAFSIPGFGQLQLTR
jgi:hypothetical protein